VAWDDRETLKPGSDAAAEDDLQTLKPGSDATRDGEPVQTFRVEEGAVSTVPGEEDFGRYRLLDRLGQGGMGVVYKARDRSLNRTVALKQLMGEEHGVSREQVERFLREARAAAKLRHPGIVAIHDVGVLEGRHYLTMDYVDGADLGRWLAPRAADKARGSRRGMDRFRDEVALLRDVARAVGYAHGRGIVHRDLKPGNILLDREERPHVADFGLAKEISGEEIAGDGKRHTLTVSGQLLGTPAYMAPEQAEGSAGGISPATDVWALGIILYETLTGKRPFAGASLTNVIFAILEKDPHRPRKANKWIPLDVETITLKCLEKDPARRYRNGTELADDLDRWLRNEPIVARPPSLSYRVRKRILRHKAAAGLACALLLAIIAAGGLWWRGVRAKRQAAEATRALLRSLRDNAELWVEAALAHRAAGNREKAWEYWPRMEKRVDDLLRKAPLLAEPHFYKGRMLRVIEREEDALKAQDEALRLDPDLGAALYERVVLLSGEYYREREKLRRDIKRKWAARISISRAPPSRTRRGSLSPLLRLPELERQNPLLRKLRERIRVDVERLEGLIKEGKAGEAGLLRVSEAQSECARGILALRRYKRREAKVHLMNARKLGGEMEEIYTALGQLALDLWKWDDAIRWFGAGHEKDRGYIGHLQGLVKACREKAIGRRDRGKDARRDFRDGIRWCDRALELVPGHMLFLYRKANFLRQLGALTVSRGGDPEPLYEEAIKAFDLVIAKKPDNANAYNCRGAVYEHMGHARAAKGLDPTAFYGKAISDYNESLKRNPENGEAHINRGNTYLSVGAAEADRGKDPRGSYEKAITDYGEALKIIPESEYAYNNRGIAHRRKGDAEAARGIDPRASYERAIADLVEAMKRDPGMIYPYINRGITYLHRGDAEAARGIDPMGSYDGAISDCDEALKRNPKYADAYHTRGVASFRKGVAEAGMGADPGPFYERALRDLDTTLELNPAYWSAHAVKGSLYNVMKRWDEAAASFKAALAICPGQHAIEEGLAQALRMKTADSLPWAKGLVAAEAALSARDFAKARGAFGKAFARIEGERARRGETGWAKIVSNPATKALLAGARYNYARCCARAAAGKEGPRTGPKPITAEERERYCALAIGQLREAIRLGWKDMKRLKKDPDLEPIRKEPRFKELLKEPQ
jgi:serine/threonine-protein kinase